MNVPLSARLTACCNYVNRGSVVADIGCDHGYLGIHLLQSGYATRVYAADVSDLPLQSAMRNAQKYGVADKMRFFLSNGLAAVPHDFDTLVCAGMGADTIIAILSAAPWLKSAGYRMILQCQSRRSALRAWLSAQGYTIRSETLARDGKFLYPVMEVVCAPSAPLTRAQCLISPALLRSGNVLLPEFFARVRGGVEATIAGLEHSGEKEKLAHYRAILAELSGMEAHLSENRQ